MDTRMHTDADPPRAHRSYALCFWFGAYLVDRGVMTFPAVLKTFFAVVMSAMGVGQASGLAPDAQKAQLSTRSIFQLLDTVPSIDADSEAGMGGTLPRFLFMTHLLGEHICFEKIRNFVFALLCFPFNSGSLSLSLMLGPSSSRFAGRARECRRRV